MPETLDDPKAIKVACRPHDWTQALFDKKVQAKTFNLEILDQAHEGLASVLGPSPSLDFAEYSLAGIVQARAKGVPVKALPVFIRCSFRHSYIFIRTGSGIEEPKDLEGRRVGTTYGMTANVWARGLLQHEYGVRLERIHWLNRESPDKGPYYLPPGMVLEPIAPDVDLETWLVNGEIDALVHASAISVFRLPGLLAQGPVKRLFAKAADEERKSYLQSRVIPIMNVIVCREEDVRVRPQLIREVFEAFCCAKERGLEAVKNNRRSGLLWYWEALEDQLALVGEDPAPYSVEKNRHILETFMRYAAEQGLISGPLRLEDIFLTELDG